MTSPVKLTAEERATLRFVRDSRAMAIRNEVAQKLCWLGLITIRGRPQTRWQLTPAGRAALEGSKP